MTILTSTFASTVWAQSPSACVNDPQGMRRLSDQRINESIQSNQDPLMRAFRNSQASAGGASCPTERSGFQRNCDDLRMVAERGRAPRIKKECIQTSTTHGSGTGNLCNQGRHETFVQGGSRGACLNEDAIDYIHYATNLALNCLSSGRTPIDANYALRILNAETGFNYFLTSGGGVGIGQVTPSPIWALSGRTTNGRFQPGEGQNILRSVIGSNNPACRPFAEALSEDLVRTPPLPSSRQPQNYCHWVNPGSGLARSLVYSMGLFVHLRDNVVIPQLRRKSPSLAQYSDLVNSLAVVGYGREGTKKVTEMIDPMVAGENPAVLTQRVRTTSAYFSETQGKLDRLGRNRRCIE